MTTTSTYTPLESLLLFQSLAAYGTTPIVFNRIADLLKSNSLVRADDSFDAGRLSAESLRELYVQLLREEVRYEATYNDEYEDASTSKKRKLQIPPLPVIKEPTEYDDKLPQLVDRLYARYRDHMIRSIREDERRYNVIQQEIAEIDRGEWDERIAKEDQARGNMKGSSSPGSRKTRKTPLESQATASGSGIPAEPDNQSTGVSTEPVTTERDQPDLKSPSSPSLLNRGETRTEGLAISEVLNSQDSVPATSPGARDSRDQVSQPRNGSHPTPPAGHQRTVSNDRPHGPSPLQPVQQRPADNYKWEQYQGGPVAQPHSPFPPAPYPPFSSQQYPPYHPPPRGSFSGPHGPLPPHSQVPSSPLNAQHPNPIVLPPPTIARGPGSPARPLDALADIAEQQYRAPSASPSLQQGVMSSSGFVQPYTGYSPQFRPNDGRPQPGSGIPPHWNQQYIPPYAAPPNYGYPPQPSPVQRPFQTRPDITQPEQRQYNSPYNANNGPRPPLPDHLRTGAPPSAASTPRQGRESAPHTPVVGRPRHSTGKATQWTPNPTASTPKAPRSSTRPEVEPISPIIPPAKLVRSNASNERGRKSEASAKIRERPQRGSQRTRAGSTASSVIAGSYRSQSVTSHADELSLDNEGVASRKLKQESATPRAAEDTGDTTADESTARQARSSLRDVFPSQRRTKRKRQDSAEPEPPGAPTHVLWTRNFQKISASALERIGAHRNASTFALPIKERDAPGYKSVILRPQDLKSIRSAIIAGNKSGNAIVATMDDQGQQSMMLPISEDLIPPKGIVNNSQLEKELMHMFANAIMFNLDPMRSCGKSYEIAMKIPKEAGGQENYEVDENGVVKDTNAMFADVEKIVGEMRSAERRSEDGAGEGDEEEMDELAGDGDHGGSVAKRRRRA